MSDVYENLKNLGLSLPKVPPKGGIYSSAKQFGDNLVYISGCGPIIDKSIAGKVGSDFTKEEAQLYARNTVLNVLASLEDSIGDLNRVKQAVKLLVYVNSEPDFYDQAYVANGASQLLVDLFGEENGAPTRSAVGMVSLPGNLPVETEAIFEIKKE